MGRTVRSMALESVAPSAMLCCPTAPVRAATAAVIASPQVNLTFCVQIVFMVVLLSDFSFFRLNRDNGGNREVFLRSLCLLLAFLHVHSTTKADRTHRLSSYGNERSLKKNSFTVRLEKKKGRTRS